MKMPHFPVPTWKNNNKYNFENITILLKALGNPHLKLPPIIHIAGTNGKGSSAAMLKSIFTAAGYKTHVYTSPHLLEFNERIVIAGEKISDKELWDVCEQVRIASIKTGIEPAFFEGTTVAAFLAFANNKADILILETGLGGRLDATNIITNPLITLITPISYDHMDRLGETLSLIAKEKAGIIKPNVPCVISSQVEEVYEVLFAKAAELNSPVFCYEYDFGIKKTIQGFTYLSQNFTYEFPAPLLAGDHQLINAAAVIAAISLVNKQFNVSNKTIEEGLKNTIWPARIQKIDQQKYSKLLGCNIYSNDLKNWNVKQGVSERSVVNLREHVNPPQFYGANSLKQKSIQIWVDGAHNSSGAQVLAAWMHDNLKPPIYLILGMTKNRNVEEFCSYFKGLTIKGYAVKVLSEPLSYSAETISQRGEISGINFNPADSLEEAIKEISKLSDKANIIITGSLFLAADFFKLI
ncbi:bifunctional folylpolyglutamate synthase/dihydrofolate synthase [Rickettsia endosymbiont of Halotydeus destructor]|uniref:bifunctional folylpolyglutamate synthase/dihydrofolate synthase n=1 Tax=Rickettsia endosymbiont of Halotydeus destructor TaxID=2996754 RepID=UPI003BB154A9